MGQTKQQLAKALTPRAIGDGDPEAYSYDELRLLIALGLKHGRGLLAAGQIAASQEAAEAFRRRCVIIWILRSLPDRHRSRPCGQTTKNKVRSLLRQMGIPCSERTLARDYKAVGGAKALRNVKPFEPGEDRITPFGPLPEHT
jgi:hypothetical protein